MVFCGSMFLSLRLAVKHGCKQELRGLRLPFVVIKKFPPRLILLLLDSVCVFNDALKIGSICSQLPLPRVWIPSIILDPLQGAVVIHLITPTSSLCYHVSVLEQPPCRPVASLSPFPVII